MQDASGEHSLPAPGERVDRYRILAKIAEGGMAAVYAVRRDHATFDKLLAMKLLLPHLRAEKRFVEMLVDEARIAAHVDHPNVVRVFDVGEQDGSPYIVMEYLRGVSLATVLKREEPALRQKTLYGVLADIANGLDAAHKAVGGKGEALAIVHRDVSPQNAMLTFDGHVKVVDFGIAAARGRLTTTETGEVKGKLAYVAPEQLHRRHPVDQRTDVWALGVMAWQALAGRPLFRGETASDTMWNILNREVPDLLEIDDALPIEVVELIDRCLSREPFSRPSSAAECAKIFRAASGLADHELRLALTEDLGAAFEAERISEDERTQSLIQLSTQTEPTHEPEPQSKSRLGLSLAAIGVVTVGIAVALGLAGSPFTEADVPSTPPEEPEAPPQVVDAPPETDDESRFVELAVPSDAILVLVDGQRHDERPLRVSLAAGGSAEVVTIGDDGEARVVVTEDSPRGALATAGTRPRRSTMRQRPTRMTMRPAMMDERPDNGLLEVPL